MNYASLVSTLKAVDKPTQSWESPDGTKVLVLPHGGRILGLFTAGDEDNLLWTHSALAAEDTARAFYAGNQWHNSGGARTWLAPEVDFFFPDFPSLNRYFQQRELDPGKYHATFDHGVLTWSTAAQLTLSRSQDTVGLSITKSLSPAPNPLRHDSRPEWSELKYAGYTLSTSLQLTGTVIPSQVGLWHLLQMPHGGELLVPTLSRTDPKVYMGNISEGDLAATEHLVRYCMRAQGEHKLGIRAIALAGRAGYIYENGTQSTLLIQNFQVNPSGEYVDVPWQETENFGFAFQACNVNSALGAFSELEYHVPAIGSSEGITRSDDRSQLWAYRGPASAIRAVARTLLSAEV